MKEVGGRRALQYEDARGGPGRARTTFRDADEDAISVNVHQALTDGDQNENRPLCRLCGLPNEATPGKPRAVDKARSLDTPGDTAGCRRKAECKQISSVDRNVHGLRESRRGE